MPDKHAMLGPSSAKRWLSCTPSARLELNIPNTSSVYAEEGTRAHALAEQKLLALISNKKIAKDCDDVEMWSCTEDYRDYVEEELNEAKALSDFAKLFVEQQLDLSEWVPESFGTADAVIIADGLLEVIDFKYGKGVPVDARNNPQLRLYALGAYGVFESLYNFEAVKMVIFQPRLNSVTEDTIPVKDLLNWADTYVKPRAAQAFKGIGEFEVGDHCRFCRASSVCRARAAVAFEVIEESAMDKAILTDDEIEAVLDKLDTTEAWISDIRSYVLNRAISDGKKWKGFKLVESRTIRKITDQVKALERLEANGYDRDDVTTLKLKGLTELEKILTKKRFNELIGDLVEKPVGQPTLAKETDRRPEINPVELAFREEN